MVADLHIHTTASDGLFSPEQVLAMAARAGLSHIAITDHDTIAGFLALADKGGVGPIFPSLTKPQEHIAGLQTLRQVAAQVKIPLVAIGGITPANASDALTAGAHGIAVCQAVIAQPDVKAAAARLKSLLS